MLYVFLFTFFSLSIIFTLVTAGISPFSHRGYKIFMFFTNEIGLLWFLCLAPALSLCQSKPIVLLPFSPLLAPYYPPHHHHNHHQHQHRRRQTLQHSATWCYEATGTTPLVIICMGKFSGCLHGGRKILAAGRP